MESGSQPRVAAEEVLFLVCQALTQLEPFAALGQQVAEKACALGLLPRRHDVAGSAHALGLAELRQRYSHLPPDALQRLLAQALARRRAEAPQPAARGLTSLLEGGALGMLGGPLAAPAGVPLPPAWLRPGAAPASQPRRLLLLRECGLRRGAQHAAVVAPPADVGRQLAHQATLRGHRFAVYCLAYDRSGRYVITGSDDRLVKIWSTQTGLLQACCRGHDAELTDLAVSADNALLASASMDATVRVWSLQGEGCGPGAPVSVLAGHEGPAAFLDFHPSLPDALLSASFDGTLRIWRARDAAAPPIVLRVDPSRFGLSGTALTRLGGLAWQPAAGLRGAAGPGGPPLDAAVRLTRNMERQQSSLAAAQPAAGPSAAAAARQGSREARQADAGDSSDGEGGEGDGDGGERDGGGGASGLLVCGFSPDGTHIVAGGNDCSVYIWQWAAATEQQQPAAGAPAAGGDPGRGPAAPTAARDGQRGAEPIQQAASSPAAGAGPAAAAAGSPRAQDAAQPPGGSSPAGDAGPWPPPRELCQLRGHRNDVVLLQFSRAGDRVATGSKDGTVRVWRRPRRWRKRPQAWEQESTFAVLPDPEAVKEARRRRRPPPAPSIDQLSWSCDDRLLLVSVTDFGIRVLAMPEARQLLHLSIHSRNVHILECHPRDPALAFSASYDGTLLVWHTRTGAVLKKFSSRHTRPDGRSWPDAIPFADGHWAPDGASITVTDVAGQLHRFALGGPPPCPLLSRAPYDQFFASDYSPLLRDLHHNVLDAETQLPPHLPEARGALCDALGIAYPEPLQRAFNTGTVLAVSAQEAAWRQPGTEPGYLLAAPTLTVAQWEAELVGGTDHAVQTAVMRAQERLTVYEDRLNAGASAAAADEAAAEAGRPARRERRRGVLAAEEAEEVVIVEEGGEPSSGEEFADDGEAGLDSDEDVDSEMLTSEEEEEEEEEEGGSTGRDARRSGGRLASRQSSRLAARGGGGGRRAAAARRATRAASAAVVDTEEDEEGENEREAREQRQRNDREARAERRRAAQQQRLAAERHRRQHAAAARRRAADDSSGEEEGPDASPAVPARAAAGQQRSRRRGREEAEAEEAEERRERKRARRGGGGGGRALSNYSWLLCTAPTAAWYAPQAGDEVVYLRQGHQAYLQGTNDKRPPPWATLRGGRALRPAEPCRVVDVRYVIANDGTDRTLAQLTLQLSDDASPLKDTCFSVEVPSPAAGFAEFVVLLSRFHAAVVERCWAVGDRCQVYWNDDEGAGPGEWWLGSIVEDTRGGGDAEVLREPYGAGGLWERFRVEWEGVASPGGGLAEERQAEAQQHSPWELFPPGGAQAAAAAECPRLDAELAQRMQAAVQEAAGEERFSIFVAAPEPEEAYVSRTRRTQHYNRLVALPLALHEVGARLQSGFYRQPAALAADLATIAANAVEFNGQGNLVAEDAAALAAYLGAVLEGREVDIAAYATFPEDASEPGPAAAAAEGDLYGRGSRRRGRQQQQEQAAAGGASMAQLQQLLEQGAALPPPPLPLPLPVTAASPGDEGRGAAGGMRVRFTVPAHLRAAAPEAAAEAAPHAATEGDAAPPAAALPATEGQAAVPTLPALPAAQPAAGGDAGTAHAAGAQPPPSLFADVAAMLAAGGSDGSAAPPATDAVAAAALAWQAAAPAPAAVQQPADLPLAGLQKEQRRGGRFAPAPASQPRGSRRATQRPSYRESDGEEEEQAPAEVDAAWAHAFEPQQQPQRQGGGVRKSGRCSMASDDEEWVAGFEDEEEEEEEAARSEDSYQPDASSWEESEGEEAAAAGARRRRAAPPPPWPSRRRSRR